MKNYGMKTNRKQKENWTHKNKKRNSAVSHSPALKFKVPERLIWAPQKQNKCSSTSLTRRFISGSLLAGTYIYYAPNTFPLGRQNQQWFFSIFQARFNFQSGEATSGVVTFMPGLGISFEVYFYNIQLFFNVPFNTKPKNKTNKKKHVKQPGKSQYVLLNWLLSSPRCTSARP